MELERWVDHMVSKIRLARGESEGDWVRGFERFESDDIRLMAWKTRYRCRVVAVVLTAVLSITGAAGVALIGWVVRHS